MSLWPSPVRQKRNAIVPVPDAILRGIDRIKHTIREMVISPYRLVGGPSVFVNLPGVPLQLFDEVGTFPGDEYLVSLHEIKR